MEAVRSPLDLVGCRGGDSEADTPQSQEVSQSGLALTYSMAQGELGPEEGLWWAQASSCQGLPAARSCPQALTQGCLQVGTQQ